MTPSDLLKNENEYLAPWGKNFGDDWQMPEVRPSEIRTGSEFFVKSAVPKFEGIAKVTGRDSVDYIYEMEAVRDGRRIKLTVNISQLSPLIPLKDSGTIF